MGLGKEKQALLQIGSTEVATGLAMLRESLSCTPRDCKSSTGREGQFEKSCVHKV